MELSNVDDICSLLLAIAQRTENRDLRVELQRTATGITQAAAGSGVGGTVGAVAGGIVGGGVGAIAGGALGAAVGAAVTTHGNNFKSVLELFEGLSDEDREKVAQVAMNWASRVSIQLTWELLNTEAAQELLWEVVQALGYSLCKLN